MRSRNAVGVDQVAALRRLFPIGPVPPPFSLLAGGRSRRTSPSSSVPPPTPSSPSTPIALVIAPLLALLIARLLHSVVSAVQEKGIADILTSCVKLIPGVSGYITAKKTKVVEKLESGNKSERDSWRTELPSVDLGRGALYELDGAKRKDVAWEGKCSGTVYIGGSESEGHFSLTNEAYSMFLQTNPLQQDLFQSVARFEREVVAMTNALRSNKEKVSGGQVCGNMTSGGIILAVKTSRDYMRSKKKKRA